MNRGRPPHRLLLAVPCVALALFGLAITPAQAQDHRPDHAEQDNRPAHARSHSQGQGHGQGQGQGQRDHDGDHDDDPDTLHTDIEHNQADDGDNLHPSGKDRQADSQNTQHNPNQGKSESDPDGMTNGGEDKPDGEGGLDREDQDGNNGCGNDDDFEDDNNGNCLGRAGAPGQQVDEDEVVENEVEVEDEVLTRIDTVVLGASLEREMPAAPTRPSVGTAVLSAGDSQAAVAAERDALAFGGIPAAGLAALALGLIGAGTVLVRPREQH